MHFDELSFPSFDFEKEIERAKWYKEDLDKGGWQQVSNSPVSQFWVKKFRGEEVPIKVLFTYDMPIPAKVYSEMINPLASVDRNNWDSQFISEKLEEYPNGNTAVFNRALTSWPLADRGFVLLLSPTKEIDWFGKKAFLSLMKNTTHPSKPEGVDGLVRAYNGGNFYIATPDDNNPENACKVFVLTNNLYKGMVPNIKCLIGRVIARVFGKLQEDIIKGYKKYYAKDSSSSV